MDYRLRCRGWGGATLVFDERVEIDEADLDDLVMRHYERLVPYVEQDEPWRVELEILNDPSDPDRFLRFGTDPTGMVEPVPMVMAPDGAAQWPPAADDDAAQG